MTPPVSPGPLILAPELLGSVDRYILIARHGGPVTVHTALPYDKRRKSSHRFRIADTRGPLDITIPVAKPESFSSATDSDILLSGHSPWWEVAMTALESAYGRTPYFEYYADEFRALLHPDRVGTPLIDLTADLDRLVCRLASIPAPWYKPLPSTVRPASIPPAEPFPVYRQVRQEKLGFIPHLSIVDLLFSLGPETVLLLTGLI